jgi:hypothetical protein
MATIHEIPIDISEEAQPEEVQPDAAPVEEEPPAPAPKKRGRPPGSRNRNTVVVVTKAAKPKKKALPPPPSEDEEESEEEEPPTPTPLRRTRSSAPQEYEHPPVDARHVAAEMLQMLSQRNANRHQAKRAKYASWFPNTAVY